MSWAKRARKFSNSASIACSPAARSPRCQAQAAPACGYGAVPRTVVVPAHPAAALTEVCMHACVRSRAYNGIDASDSGDQLSPQRRILGLAMAATKLCYHT